jgi:hypothetical protein
MAGLATTRPSLIRQVAILAGIGIAPDLDLLWGRHSMETHSIGAAAIVASIAAWQRWPVASCPSGSPSRWRDVSPHPDAMGGHVVPIGVMLLWPFSGAHQTAGSVYAISRRYWRDDF